MQISENQFYQDLSSENDVGLIIKAHLHIENQLTEFIEIHLPFKNRCNWQFISYRSKIEIAMGLGLKIELKKPLEDIGKLRNEYAHNLTYSLNKKYALNMFNGLPKYIQNGIKHSYKENINKEFVPSKIDNRDLLIVILINVHHAIKAAVWFKTNN